MCSAAGNLERKYSRGNKSSPDPEWKLILCPAFPCLVRYCTFCADIKPITQKLFPLRHFSMQISSRHRKIKQTSITRSPSCQKPYWADCRHGTGSAGPACKHAHLGNNDLLRTQIRKWPRQQWMSTTTEHQRGKNRHFLLVFVNLCARACVSVRDCPFDLLSGSNIKSQGYLLKVFEWVDSFKISFFIQHCRDITPYYTVVTSPRATLMTMPRRDRFKFNRNYSSQKAILVSHQC